MLSKEDNERLVRTAKGTLMGELFRRFWTPALLSSEVPEPDCPPVRVNILNEQLVAFRDSDGRVGLLDAFCPHRRANLFWGRNENCGLRCVYHGWKFNVDGECVDVPNVPEGDKIKGAMRTIAYPTIERGGFVWAYLGPPELRPEFSEAEVFDLPESHRHIQKVILRGNYLQFVEGDIDSSHVSFLHSALDEEGPSSARLSSFVFADRSPQWNVRKTEYGLMLAARRRAGDEDHWHWRVNQWMMPYATQIAAAVDVPFVANVRVPIDDENSLHYRVFARIDRPLDDEDYAALDAGVIFPEMIPGTFEPAANPSNDFLIDREAQRGASYTGIKSIPTQDYAVTYRQGGGLIADRSREKLTRSDTAIVAMRRRLLETLKAMEAGQEPPEATAHGAYRVRSIDKVLRKDFDIFEGTQDWTESSL